MEQEGPPQQAQRRPPLLVLQQQRSLQLGLLCALGVAACSLAPWMGWQLGECAALPCVFSA